MAVQSLRVIQPATAGEYYTCEIIMTPQSGLMPEVDENGTSMGGYNRATGAYEFRYTARQWNIEVVRWETSYRYDPEAAPRDRTFVCIVPGQDEEEETVQIRSSGGGDQVEVRGLLPKRTGRPKRSYFFVRRR